MYFVCGVDLWNTNWFDVCDMRQSRFCHCFQPIFELPVRLGVDVQRFREKMNLFDGALLATTRMEIRIGC